MASYIVNGGKRLCGEISVSGSKNAALGVVAAAMVLDGPCTIENLPFISDINVLLSICAELGATVETIEKGTVKVDPTTINTYQNTGQGPRNIRASYYLIGALLGRARHALLSLPGGCNFGTRPIDQHVKGFEALGANVTVAHGNIELVAEQLLGTHIYLDVASVGATINLMIACSKAEGTTTIENAAREPHIVDVANFLNAMGANIKGAGTDVIRIKGVDFLPGGATYAVIPDQIEAGTYMIAAAATRGDVKIKNLIPKHMEPLSVKMEEMGVHTEFGDDWVRVWVEEDQVLSKTAFQTSPYPGFPTDLQPQVTAFLTMANGLSRVYENVWDSRFQFVDELKLMGADITVSEHVALIAGPTALTGARVKARDLRAGAAMVTAALMASGESEVYNAQSIERGYEKFIEKITALGGEIRLIEDNELLG